MNYHKIWIIIINKYIVPYQQQRKIEKHWLYRYNLIDFIHDLPERRSLEDMITRAVFTQSLYTLTRGQKSRDDDREVTIENRLKGTMEKHSALHRHSSRLFVNGYDRTHFYRHGTWSLRWVDSVANLSLHVTTPPSFRLLACAVASARAHYRVVYFWMPNKARLFLPRTTNPKL